MSIINDKNKIKTDYFSPKNIGDSVEGTYVGKRVVANSMRAGETQNVYEIKKSDGSIIDVYGKPGIDRRMKHISLGQIVGFKFTSKIPAKIPGYKDTNVIEVYADDKIVDKEWLESPEAVEAIADALGGTVVPSEVSQESNDEADIEQVLKEINNLAVEKLGATSPEEIKTKVMEATNLAFLESNLSQILEALKALPEKK
jgi:hypothetical protein